MLTRRARHSLPRLALVAATALATAAPGLTASAAASPAEARPAATTPAAVVASFPDTTTNPFALQIDWMAQQRITTGYPDGTYRPFQAVRRDEFAAFIYRLAGRPSFTAPPISPFRDLTPTSTFYKEITWLRNRGLETAPTGSSFRPGDPVTRAAAAVILARLNSPVSPGPTQTPFSDVLTSDPNYNEISWLAAAGISRGWTESDGRRTFRPTESVRRDTAAAFLYAYTHRSATSGGLAPAPITCWPTLGGVTVTAPAGRRSVIVTNGSSGTYAVTSLHTRLPGTNCGWRTVFSDSTSRIGSGGFVNGATRVQGTNTTPLGTYTITEGFGLATPPATQLSYRRAVAGDWWVQQKDSRWYNQYRSAWQGGFALSTATSERLTDYPGQYDYVAVINFNRAPDTMVTGRGAGIFLHVNGPRATGGCVSISRQNMITAIQTLRPGDAITIAR